MAGVGCPVLLFSGGIVREKDVVFKHKPEPVNLFLRVVMAAVPALVVELCFNLSQPCLGGFVHLALVNAEIKTSTGSYRRGQV